MTQKVVFLDRDGTLNVDYGYVYKLSDLKLLPGTGEALQLFQKNGFKLIVITNQSGIGRGFYTLIDAVRFNNALNTELEKYNVHIEEFFICTHAPEDKCICRKPSPFMVLEAIKKYHIDVGASYLFGDKLSDIQCGENAEVASFLVTKDNSLLYWANLLLKQSI